MNNTTVFPETLK